MVDLDPEQTDALADERAVLLKLGYRMLGSTADAEDAVQETYLRWYRLSEEDRRAIAQPVAWLVKAATRVCLDMLGSARARRERYVGPWLPEPIPNIAPWAQVRDTEASAAAAESVSMALLVVLEAMTPAERIAFVLHDLFGYAFTDVAEILGRSTQACRQLASSGRRRVRAALEPVWGAEAVADLFLAARDRQPGLVLEAALVNGEPGLRARMGVNTVAVIAFDIAGGLARNLWVMRNPQKLRAWN